jgi:hypothetical protein
LLKPSLNSELFFFLSFFLSFPFNIKKTHF